MVSARSALTLLTSFSSVVACGPLEDPAPSEGGEEALDVDDVGKHESALTTNVGLAAVADTEVVKSSPNRTAGAQTTVRVRQSGPTRSLFRFDTADIQSAVQGKTLLRARLRVTLNTATSNMTTSGRNVDVHRMTTAWTETGASWSCANDTVPGNSTLNCATEDRWTMGMAPLPYAAPAAATQLVANNFAGYVTFDVTGDVSAILADPATNLGWLIKLQNESLSGSLVLRSHDLSDPPRLIIDAAGPCRDGVTDTLNGEQCDDGNTNAATTRVTFTLNRTDGRYRSEPTEPTLPEDCP